MWNTLRWTSQNSQGVKVKVSEYHLPANHPYLLQADDSAKAHVVYYILLHLQANHHIAHSYHILSYDCFTS